MKSFSQLLPDAKILLELEPEDLAGFVLEYLNTLPKGHGELNSYNFCQTPSLKQYPAELYESIQRALMEAWIWLEREGLIAPKPDSFEGRWIFVTRKGRQLLNRMDLDKYCKSSILPKEYLHPILAQKSWPAFIRGDYDTAIFQAFKEVEVAVRKAAAYDHTVIGVELMRKAFHKMSGPLRDNTAPPSEREALSHLFAGAIGLYKNPLSHKNVDISDPKEASELLIFASYLLKLVESRSS